jgi:alkanesulfonate monooxygenase SsuD/methylene tetrahydromethanopterin reductase-like flavin-dependent oxidoreductase (luciferase family)
MFGIDFPGVGDRMTLLDETLTAFDLLCRSEGRPVSWQGRHLRLDRAVFDPGPVRPAGIPVLVGGSGPRLKRFAARHATMFNSFAAPWEWPAVNAGLDDDLAAAGRDPGSLERTAFVFAELSGDRSREDALVETFRRTRGGSDDEVRRRVLLGSPEQMASTLRAYADAGVTLAIVNLRPPHVVEELERFATTVMPLLT